MSKTFRQYPPKSRWEECGQVKNYMINSPERMKDDCPVLSTYMFFSDRKYLSKEVLKELARMRRDSGFDWAGFYRDVKSNVAVDYTLYRRFENKKRRLKERRELKHLLEE